MLKWKNEIVKKYTKNYSLKQINAIINKKNLENCYKRKQLKYMSVCNKKSVYDSDS